MSKASIQYLRAKRYPLRPSTNGTLYGVNVFEPPYLASHVNVITTAQTLGVQVIRCAITWSNMQTTVGGSIDWSEFDSIYAKCVAAGITIIFVIETTPVAYNTTPHGFFGSAPSVLAVPTVTDPTYFPLWVSDQAAWAGQVAARYPLALLEWWNEWASGGSGYWLENNSSANKPTISAWVTAYNAAYTAIKAANSSSTVAVGGLTALTHWFGANATVGVEAIRQLMQTYSIVTDAISIHPYTGDASSPDPSLDHYGPFGTAGFANSFDDIARVQQLMISCGYGNTPLWVTEWGNYSAAAVGGASVKAGYVTTSLQKIQKLYSPGAVGTGKAGVTIATFYPMIDQSSTPTDTGLVGPNGNGPYTLNSSGTAYQTFMTGLGRVPSSITISPSSFSVGAGSTQALTATVYDQFSVPIVGATVSWASSDVTKATVDSSGLVTGVASGSVTITATSGIAFTGRSTGTITGATVTSVNLFYSSQAALPMVLFTGSTYTLVAKDQSGNVLGGGVGTWSTTDGTNAPVGASTGIIAPASGVTGATITYTHTASGHTGTVAMSVLKVPTWLKQENVTYANDAALRGNIRSNVTTGLHSPAPTGAASSLYQDGLNESQVTADATRLYTGRQTLLMTLPNGGGDNGTGGVPQLAAPLGATYARIHVLVVKRYDSGFTSNGGGGGSASYKDGPFVYNAGLSGRCGIAYTNTSQIISEALLVVSGSFAGGADETGIGTVSTEWTDQAWYCDYFVYEIRSSNIMSIRPCRFKVGTNPLSANMVSGSAVEGPMNAGQVPMVVDYISALGQNYNLTLLSTLYKSIGFWGCVDGVTYGDPLGILNDATSPTLTGISGGTVTHGTNNNTITLTGTNYTVNCWPIFSNSGILVQSITVTNSTTLTIVVNVTGGATPGAGTVLVRNGSSLQNSATQTVTVT